MSLDVDVSSDGVRSPLGRRRTQEVVQGVLRSEKVRNALVSITFVAKRAMGQLNATHLGHKGATDVISFGFSRAMATDPVVGDIYICPDVARDNARSRREPVRREIARLVVHGTLHILGHDHPDEGREKSAMWRKQERLVASLVGRPDVASSAARSGGGPTFVSRHDHGTGGKQGFRSLRSHQDDKR
jgi:probable rRNA maturation factor